MTDFDRAQFVVTVHADYGTRADQLAAMDMFPFPFCMCENAEGRARIVSTMYPALRLMVERQVVTADDETNAGDVERSQLEAVYAGGVSQSFLEEVK